MLAANITKVQPPMAVPALPFDVAAIPVKYPAPAQLRLWIVDLD